MEIQSKDMENSKERPTSLEMQAIGNLEVIERLRKKKNQLEKSDPQANEIKTALILEGGGQKGVIGAGATVGLEAAGMIDAFDYSIGVSSGACGIAYTAAGAAALGTSAYYEDNVRGGFVDLKRLKDSWKLVVNRRPKGAMDIRLIERVMRRDKQIDITRLRTCRSTLIVGVMNAKTGEEEYFDIKKLEDPLKVVVGSICVPVFSGGDYETVNETHYIDGSFGDPIPIRFAIENLGCTDILIVLNSPFRKREENPRWVTMIFNAVAQYPFGYSKGVRRAIQTYQKRYNETLDFIKETIDHDPQHRILVIAPKNEVIDNFTMDAEKLKAAAEEGAEFMKNLLPNKK